MVTTGTWALTLGAIAGLFALDLVAARRPLRFRAAAGWSVLYTAVACAFGLVLGALVAWDLSTQYFAGFVVEKSLSIDNLFVFVVILSSFAVPPERVSRVLTIGILLALVMRAVFIAAGAALLDAFAFTFVAFGVLLLATAVQLLRHRGERPRVPFADRLARSRTLSPTVVVLGAIAITDVLFALDSIPAVFGVTQSAYVVFCANAFALLGLRPLYFLVAGLLNRLTYLSVGLSLILAFIGAKLILHYAHEQTPAVPEPSSAASLAFIAAILGVTTVASLRRPGTRDQHASTRPIDQRVDATTELVGPRSTPATARSARRAGARGAR